MLKEFTEQYDNVFVILTMQAELGPWEIVVEDLTTEEEFYFNYKSEIQELERFVRSESDGEIGAYQFVAPDIEKFGILQGLYDIDTFDDFTRFAEEVAKGEHEPEPPFFEY